MERFYYDLVDQMEISRISKRMTLRQISDLTGISSSTIAKDRSDPSRIPMWRFRKYLKAIGIKRIQIESE